MIKKLLLAVCIVTGAQAHIPKFPLEQQIADLYLAVNPDVNRIYMQKLEEEFMKWLLSVKDDIRTKEDSIYIRRLSDMYAGIYIGYHFGN